MNSPNVEWLSDKKKPVRPQWPNRGSPPVGAQRPAPKGRTGLAGRRGVGRPSTRVSVEWLNSGGSGLRSGSAVGWLGVAVVMKCLVVQWDVGRAAHGRPLRADGS
jgi:hypothetical protein